MAQSSVISRPVSHSFLGHTRARQVLALPRPFLRSLRIPKTCAVLEPERKSGPLRKNKKSRIDDGIFGTSLSFGFTKTNELLVGRLAMLGFAASILGEAVTGKGVLAQLNMETGINLGDAEPLLLLFILGTLTGAVGGFGDRGKFVQEVPTLANYSGVIKGILGRDDSGPLAEYTKVNELFIGRLAQLGFAASVIGELLTGQGALAQLNLETGLGLNKLQPLVVFSIFFFVAAAINPGTGQFSTDDDS